MVRNRHRIEFAISFVRQRVVCMVIGLALVGCGSSSKDRLPLHKAAAKVTLNSEPLEGVSIVFHSVPPLKAPSGKSIPAPGAESGFDGGFQVTTYRVGDGIPEGEYVVTLSCEDRSAEPVRDEYPELLPSQYQDPAKSGIKVSIRAGQNNLKAFELHK